MTIDIVALVVGTGVRDGVVKFVAALAGCKGNATVAGWFEVLNCVGVLSADEGMVWW